VTRHSAVHLVSSLTLVTQDLQEALSFLFPGHRRNYQQSGDSIHTVENLSTMPSGAGDINVPAETEGVSELILLRAWISLCDFHGLTYFLMRRMD
jgi:hypothetical protein